MPDPETRTSTKASPETTASPRATALVLALAMVSSFLALPATPQTGGGALDASVADGVLCRAADLTLEGGCQLWEARFDGPPSGSDEAKAVETGPDGDVVYVTGTSDDADEDYLTVAYDAGEGTELWTARFDGGGADRAADLAVAGDGETVFVTGASTRGGDLDYGTVAYNASNGSQRWSSFHDGPVSRADRPAALAVGPDGDRVVVTGQTANVFLHLHEDAFGFTFIHPHPHTDATTVGINATDGSVDWVQRENGLVADAVDRANDVAVNATGARVVVTGAFGTSGTFSARTDYGTFAYEAASGAREWLARLDRGPSDEARALSIGPDGTIAVAGDAAVPDRDYATAAYNQTDGTELWSTGFGGTGEDTAADVTVHDGSVLVTGSLVNDATGADYGTAARSATNGTMLWNATFDGNATADRAAALAVSPDGGQVVVTGASDNGVETDYRTLAYDVSDGAERWRARYDGNASADRAADLAVGEGLLEDRVFVTGSSDGGPTGLDYGTVAYDTGLLAKVQGTLP